MVSSGISSRMGRGGVLVVVEVVGVTGNAAFESVTVRDDQSRNIRKKHTMMEDAMTLFDHELWRPRLVSAPLGPDPVRVGGGANDTTRVAIDRLCREDDSNDGGVRVGG